MRHGYIAVVLALLGCASADQLVGPWSKVADQNWSEMRSGRAESCIPRVSEIQEPIFPGAEVAFIFWAKKSPHCDSMVDTRKSELELNMVTTAQMDEVVQWYATRLGGFRRYGYPNEKGVIFVNGGPADFSWERDKKRVSFIYIGEALDGWAQLGYRTSIDIVHPKP